MKSDHELIAEFMGERVKFVDGIPMMRTAVSGLQSLWIELQYDTSWNQLMPVVERIRPLWAQHQVDEASELMAALFRGDITVSYKCVVRFISWYTSTKNREDLKMI